MKKIIITADDLGIDKDTNKAIKECFEFGLLKTSCIMADGNAFDDAVETVVRQYPDLEIGVHLDIIECKALTQNSSSLLTDENGVFNNSYHKMLLKSGNKEFLNQVEAEFRAQIEKILDAGIRPVYINTHVHTHSIPAIFEIVCKLATEYSIPYTRTQAECPYYTKGISRHLSIHYCLNIIKNILLNTFSFINKSYLKKTSIKTNPYFLGVLYTGQMDEHTIMAGINRLPDNAVCEIILHPSVNPQKPKHYREYIGLTSKTLRQYFEANDVESVTWQSCT